ncbi:MAG: hypothetical protein HDS13_06085 [Bacteroides sp.]|nr:hypothetical protein [Bacteroides sp.]
MNTDYTKALRECIAECEPEGRTPAELIEYGFRHGNMFGYNGGFLSGYEAGQGAETARLKMATAAMQGLLAGGYLAEHSDTAAEAVRQADTLLAKITAS